MDLRLDKADADLAERARRFTVEHLLPYELECEANDGLSHESLTAIRKATLAEGFNAINHAIEDGGQGLDLFQQVLVQEEMGKATGALWDVVWRPSLPLVACSEEQREQFLRPACRGERRDCYAITEEGAGSDPTMVATVARRNGKSYSISGEKWHVTAGDIADFMLVHAHVDGDPTKATVFIVDMEAPGVTRVRSPRYMHTFVFEHPTVSLDDVTVGPERILGEVGQGFELTKDWFVEERLMIAARTVGASIRALDLARGWAGHRLAFGKPIIDHQGIGFMLADMAVEVMAAKTALYRVAWQAARGDASRSDVHYMAAAVKLLCSETAGRVIDRAVQIHGGRGYMTEQPVERLWRELRVDRIWEGTSEIQRMILQGELRKRGADLFTSWPITGRDPIP